MPESLLAASIASVRFLALFAVAPVFGHAAVPMRVRMGLAIWVAIGLGALHPVQDLAELLGERGLALLVIAELGMGLALGFATRLIFASFGLAGEIMSIQGGLGAASVIDPTSGGSSVALASLLQVFATLIFLALEGHHAVLRTLDLFLTRFPIGAAPLEAGAWLGVVSLGSGVFELAVRLAAPITATMLLANLAVGILGRAMPQLNLMTVQLPALVALTLLLLALGSGVFVEGSASLFEGWASRVVATLAGGG